MQFNWNFEIALFSIVPLHEESIVPMWQIGSQIGTGFDIHTGAAFLSALRIHTRAFFSWVPGKTQIDLGRNKVRKINTGHGFFQPGEEQVNTHESITV